MTGTPPSNSASASAAAPTAAARSAWLQRLEVLHAWRRAFAWAPVLWFPGALYSLLTERLGWAVALGLAGLAFAGISRAIPWLAACPRCGVRFGSSGESFRSFWQAARCQSCGLTLFELRRSSDDGSD